jgi:hypothetical protein
MNIIQKNVYRFETVKRCQLEELRAGDLFMIKEGGNLQVVVEHKLTATICRDVCFQGQSGTCEHHPAIEVYEQQGRLYPQMFFGAGGGSADANSLGYIPGQLGQRK